eukprot:TRINITY_DN16168_c0_g1_i1.p4 TRINITY_DN16168_c0_g1~~TRINITY_DN16168_c0_g1_i1.p4  ORF type:complete len:129 (-),score=1.55 TRINITY_DN16168_c0_g1_i1:36-422(-)
MRWYRTTSSVLGSTRASGLWAWASHMSCSCRRTACSKRCGYCSSTNRRNSLVGVFGLEDRLRAAVQFFEQPGHRGGGGAVVAGSVVRGRRSQAQSGARGSSSQSMQYSGKKTTPTATTAVVVDASLTE